MISDSINTRKNLAIVIIVVVFKGSYYVVYNRLSNQYIAFRSDFPNTTIRFLAFKYAYVSILMIIVIMPNLYRCKYVLNYNKFLFFYSNS